MVKVCVAGCLHGELDKMYEDVKQTELKFGIKTDIILCCGDFQSIRNESDLSVMSVPMKYRRLGDFWKYYSGEAKAPYLTVFVGGNHEASNYLQELPYGGWVAKGIYYMGYAGVVRYRGLRIAGLSGIYKRHDYCTGHHEHAPYDDRARRTAYHTRLIDAFRLRQVCRGPPVDVCLSHDWPRGVYRSCSSAALDALARRKPHLMPDISSGCLGSDAARDVLAVLRPRYWFAAHMHCKIAAVVDFGDRDDHAATTTTTTTMTTMTTGSADHSNAAGTIGAAAGAAAASNVNVKRARVNNNRYTRFLALDKCLPRSGYLQFLDIDPVDGGAGLDGDSGLYLDPEWLCILRATNHLMSISKTTTIMPAETGDERWDFSVTDDDLKDLSELFNDQFKIPDNFAPTAPVHHEEYEEASSLAKPVAVHANPQTDLICAMLELVHPNAEFLGRSCTLSELSKTLKEKQRQSEDSDDDGDVGGDGDSGNDGSICSDDGSDHCLEESLGGTSLTRADTARKTEINPEEINIDDIDEEVEEGHEGSGTERDQEGDSHQAGGEQYDPTDYPAEESDEDAHGYCPSEPFV